MRLVVSFRVFSAEWPSKHAKLLLRMIGNCLSNAVINAWCILSGGCLYIIGILARRTNVNVARPGLTRYSRSRYLRLENNV